MNGTGRLLLLSQADLRAVMSFGDYVDAVAEGFRSLAEGVAGAAPPLKIAAGSGTFHAKGGFLPRGPGYVAVKVNANFPQNPGRGLPTIQGAILLFETGAGAPLAVLDSIEITRQRTGAATALAARSMARPDSRVATICGCGEQGSVQLRALRHILPLERAFAWDADPLAARDYARRLTAELGFEVTEVAELREASLASDVIATCTSSASPFLDVADVRPGTFIAAVGADAPGKSEIRPALVARARVVADLVEQAATMGDLHHAIAAGAVGADHPVGELADLVAGRLTGRTSPDDITLFDSTGVGLQDVAAAAVAYERAVKKEIGLPVNLRGAA
jgi:ornithine cyclodeaminase/alanine dehydrogenase-like protein (mu-crystallin family)